MGKVILGVTISLDGFAEDSNRSVGALYPDLDTLRNTEVSAGTTEQCIRAGLADELHIDIIPVFLKTGFRPFEDIGKKSIKVVRLKVVGLPAGRTHLRFRFVK